MCLMRNFCFNAVDLLHFIKSNKPSSADLALKPANSTLPDYVFIDFYDDDLYEIAQNEWITTRSQVVHMSELPTRFDYYLSEALRVSLDVCLLYEASSICVTVRFENDKDIAIFTLYFDVCTK